MRFWPLVQKKRGRISPASRVGCAGLSVRRGTFVRASALARALTLLILLRLALALSAFAGRAIAFLLRLIATTAIGLLVGLALLIRLFLLILLLPLA